MALGSLPDVNVPPWLGRGHPMSGRRSILKPIRAAVVILLMASTTVPLMTAVGPALAAPRTPYPSAQLEDRPASGPAGVAVRVRGRSFGPTCDIYVTFTDSNGAETQVAEIPAQPTFSIRITIPIGASLGSGSIMAF